MFSLLVASVKDYAIFMLDPQGHIISWNEGAQRIKGYSATDIIGKHFSIFYTKSARDSAHPLKELEIATKVGRYEEEGWRVRKDGSQFWANVVITAVRDKAGQLVGFAKVTRDLTERKHAEMQREETARRLAESNEDLQRLAYVVSHELQAPIAIISRYCRLLTVRYKDRLGKDANDFMDRIVQSSDLIARMIDDLWTYARVNQPQIDFAQVDINEVFEQAMKQLQDQISAGEVERCQLPVITANKEQLTYLFKELILNAVKYRSEAPPAVTIAAEQRQQGWVISFQDNGIGLDASHNSEVFRMFHRLSGGPVPSATGMGLTICKKIVEVHKGRIWYESPGAGLGTTFYVWLPS